MPLALPPLDNLASKLRRQGAAASCTHPDTNLLVLRLGIGVKVQNANCAVEPHPKLAALALAVKQAVCCKGQAGRGQGGRQA